MSTPRLPFFGLIVALWPPSHSTATQKSEDNIEPSEMDASNAVASTTSTAAAGDVPKPQRRQSTLDDAQLQKLEQRLKQRPERDELEGRNILKDGSVAPALVANAEKLKKSQREDSLNSKLSQRPSPDELVKDGILNSDETPSKA